MQAERRQDPFPSEDIAPREVDWRLDRGELKQAQVIGLSTTRRRAGITALAAAHLAEKGRSLYQHEGRGPVGFDMIGLVRAAVQLAVDHDPLSALYNPGPAIADLGDYAPLPARDLLSSRLASLALDWGLDEVEGVPALPGDVVIWENGQAAAMAVVIFPAQIGPPTVAFCFSPSAPATAMLKQKDVRLFRWNGSSRPPLTPPPGLARAMAAA